MTEEALHLVVERSALHKALAHCQGVVERRNTVPILAHVLLEARNNTLKITATDLELTLIETVPAHIKKEGKTTVSAHLLFDVVRKLNEGADIELKTTEEEDFLQLQSGKSAYNFPCLPSIEFPALLEENHVCTFKIPAPDFLRLIDKTHFSMSTQETRYHLNGIFFHTTEDGFLKAVTTDGLRLATAQVALPSKILMMPQVIMARKTIQEIRKLIDGVTGEITIALSDTQVRFDVGSSVLISRLIEGKFPDYEQVIPFGNDKVLETDVKAFAEAVDRVSLMSTDKLRPVKIQITGDTMLLSAHSSEIGNAVEELDIKYEGDPIEFGFNARFVLDVTQQIASPTLQFLIGDETQAIIAKDAVDDASLYVLMPMRV